MSEYLVQLDIRTIISMALPSDISIQFSVIITLHIHTVYPQFLGHQLQRYTSIKTFNFDTTIFFNIVQFTSIRRMPQQRITPPTDSICNSTKMYNIIEPRLYKRKTN